MYPAVAIANYFVKRAAQEGVRDITPAKLHDLVYFAHGWRLGIVNRPMITSTIMAAKDGLIISDLRESGCWGSKRIEGLIETIQMDESRGVMAQQTPELAPDDPAITSLEWVWKAYGKLSPYDLSRATREVGSPWDLIWNDEERPDDEPKKVPNGTIRLWFKDLSARRKHESRNHELSAVQQREATALEDTQQLLEAPNPDRLRAV